MQQFKILPCHILYTTKLPYHLKTFKTVYCLAVTFKFDFCEHQTEMLGFIKNIHVEIAMCYMYEAIAIKPLLW